MTTMTAVGGPPAMTRIGGIETNPNHLLGGPNGKTAQVASGGQQVQTGQAFGQAQRLTRPMLGGPMQPPGGTVQTGQALGKPQTLTGNVMLGGGAAQTGQAFGQPQQLQTMTGGSQVGTGQAFGAPQTLQSLNPLTGGSQVQQHGFGTTATIGGPQALGGNVAMHGGAGATADPNAMQKLDFMATSSTGGTGTNMHSTRGDVGTMSTGGTSGQNLQNNSYLQGLLDKLQNPGNWYDDPNITTVSADPSKYTYVDFQTPLQRLQGYQQGILTLMEGMLGQDKDKQDLFAQLLTGQQSGDHDLMSQIFGGGFLDDNTRLSMNQRLFNSASPYGTMGTAGQNWMNQGAFSDSMSSLFGGIQNEGMGAARDLMKGLFSNEEMGGLIDSASPWSQNADRLASEGLFTGGERGQYMDVFNQLFGRGTAANDRGGITADQEGDFRNRLDQAGNAASGIAETGGMDGGSLDTIRSLFGGQDSRLSRIADQGILSKAEIDKQAAATKQDIMEQGRAQAESLYSGSLGSGAPFAGAALVNKSNTDAGKAAGQERANLLKYNADSKMTGSQMLGDNINSRAGFESDVAGGRREGAGMIGDLASKAGDFYLGQGGQRLQGLDALSGMGGQLQDFLRAGAEGRTDGMNQQGNVADYMRQLFGDNASSRQGGLDSLLDIGSNYRDFWNTDFQGQLEGFDRMQSAQDSYMDRIINGMNENDKLSMPSYIFGNVTNPVTGERSGGLFDTMKNRLGQSGGNTWQSILQQLTGSTSGGGNASTLNSLLAALGG